MKTSSLHSTTAVYLEGFVIRIFFNLEEAYWENFLLFAIILCILHIVCLSRFFFSSLFIRFAVFDIWKLIQLYAAVYQVCMQALSILLWSSSTWPFFIILLLIQCTDSYQKCIHRQYVFPFFFLSFSFFIFYFLFFCLPNLEDCEPAVWRHLISCVCLLLCGATKDCIHYKLFIVLKRCVIELPCMLDMYGFSFCAWRCPFLSDDSSMALILHLGLLTFLGQRQKSDRTSHPL